MSLAEAVTDAAIARVRSNADETWVREAERIISLVVRRQRLFTTDDLWEAGLPSPREPRALGAVMREAARLGICEATGEYRRSERAACHTRPIRVWKSLVGDA